MPTKLTDAPVIWWLPLGQRSYDDTWNLQKALVQARRLRRIPDVFISVEHPHVITTGRSTDLDNVLDRNAPDGSGPVQVIHIERGGDVTYHGPGQLVGYFIFNLDETRPDLHAFLRQVEEVQLQLLAAFGFEGRREEGKTGAWVGERKLGSVGIAVRNWVTYHGFALNCATDLRYFELINPCGMDAEVMSSVSELAGYVVPVSECISHLATVLEQVFGRPVLRVAEKRLTPVLAAG
jgi:lipoate-protein ligase B